MALMWFWAIATLVGAWQAISSGDAVLAFINAAGSCLLFAVILTVRAPRA